MIVAGFGFRQSATEARFSDALSQVSGTYQPTAFATLEDKVADLAGFAQSHGLDLIKISAVFAGQQTTLSLSDQSTAHTGGGSVAEATALAAAGPNARLLGPRSVSHDRLATCAIAIGDNE